jgi:hypothetical protein
MKPLLILCSFLILHSKVLSQELYPLKITPFLNKFLSQPGYAYPLSGGRYSFLDLRPWLDDFKVGAQQLIRTDSNLYVFVQNTSRMYKAVSRNSQFISFQRIDSTQALFYNIGSYQFSDGEDIYSYGGYGFWKTNGLLRKFNFKHGEWDVVPLDREIVAQFNPSNLIWYDAIKRQLHVPFQQFVNDGVKQIRHNVGEVDERSWVLDVPNRKWSQSGAVNPALLNAAERANSEVHYETQNGLVIENLFQLIRLDYRNNVFSQTGIHPITQTLNRHNPLYDLEYLIGDTVYYMNSETGKEDLVYIGGLPVMDSAELVQETNTVPIVATSLLVISVGGLLIVRSRKRRNTDERKADSIDKIVDSSGTKFNLEPDQDEIAEIDEEDLVLKQSAETTPVQLPDVSIASPFNATEKEVILLCLQRSEAGGHVDLEEINHVLGIKNKSKGLQKKVRSEVFNSINNKFRAFSNTSSGLIESVRNKDDKRYFDYFIEPVHFTVVRQVLNF